MMDNDKPTNELGFYEKLFMLGHDIELTRTVEGDEDPEDLAVPGHVTQRIITKEPTLALAYHLLVQMRGALIQCVHQFQYYGGQYEGQLDGSHLSLVERQDLEYKRDRDLGIAKSLLALVDDTPRLEAHDWRAIKTAPQDGSLIRVLGRNSDGRTYVETARWSNIQWSVEAVGMPTPTHWQPLERLPEGY